MHFSIKADELVAINQAKDTKKLEQLGGVAALATALNTNLRNGLSNTEMMTGFFARKAIFGENVYPEPKLKSIFFFIIEALQDVTMIILLICAFISLVFCVFVEEGNGCLLDSIGIFIAVFLVVSVASINNWQKERQFRDLNRVKEDRRIKVVRAGKIEEVSTYNIQVGDVVKLDAGDQIPADGFFIEGFNMACDESALTGETHSVLKDHESPFMMSGTQISDGVGSMFVSAVGPNTEWGRTLKQIAEEEAEDTPLEARLENLAKYIGYVGLTVAIADLIILTIKYLVSTPISSELFPTFMRYLVFAISIVVMAVPEGLPLAVAISLAFSMKKMLKDNNLVRHLDACETMGSATTICSDKTGTLTTNRMVVSEIWIAGQKYDAIPKPNELSDDVLNILCDSIAINSKANVTLNVDTNIPEYIGNKTECAMLLMLLKNFNVDYNPIRADADDDLVQMYTFSSERKRMSVVVRFEEDDHARILTKGAAEIVFELCDRVMDSEGNIVEIDEDTRDALNGEIRDMASKGLRTICLAFNDFEIKDEQELMNTNDPPERELICVAIVGIKDPVRSEVPDAIQICRRAGIMVRMVTGDNILTARHIAQECGIYDPNDPNCLIMEGPEFRALPIPRMHEILPRLQILARSTPTDKHLLVTQLKAMGEIVAVTGDGTNDAAALKAAHVGLAMGLSGTEVAKEASDIVIMDDNFASITKSVLWGRSVYENVRKFLQFQITINVVALAITFIGSITNRGFPLTAVQLLWLNLIMDTFAALALATEPPSDDLMSRKPHGTEDNLITNNMWKNIFGQGIFQVTVLLIDVYAHTSIFGPIGSKWSKKQDEEDYTLVFNIFVFCQLFNLFNARKINNEMNILQNITKSMIFVVILLICTAMQVLICELGYYVGFGTNGLNWLEWLVTIGVSSLSIPVGYLLRLIPVPKYGFCGFNFNKKLLPSSARAEEEQAKAGGATFRPVQEMEEIVTAPSPIDLKKISTPM
ncbi:calcium-transporting ATPase [Acrasis kona]|uniref:Calcium-transporting ATPase n=1 Tax=Acrasis kona TaxID=1008807 RepID=A0AAW2ZAW1_9EUKA